MAKCNCFRSGKVFNLHSGKDYCDGVKEPEICSCGGDMSKCDFYEYKRTASKQDENIEIEQTTFGPSANNKYYPAFQWIALSVDQPVINKGKEYYMMVCYTDPYNKLEMKVMRVSENNTALFASLLYANNILYWCYINPPASLANKQAAIKRLQDCGILDEQGNLAEAYKDIFVKVDDL